MQYRQRHCISLECALEESDLILSDIGDNNWHDPTFSIYATYERAKKSGIKLDIEDVSIPICTDWDRMPDVIHAGRQRESQEGRERRRLDKGQLKNFNDLRVCAACGNKFYAHKSVKKDEGLHCSKRCAKNKKAEKHEVNGESITLEQMADKCGVKVGTIRYRVHSGMAVEDAMKDENKASKGILLNGNIVTHRQVALAARIDRHKVSYWAKKGLDGNQIVEKFR